MKMIFARWQSFAGKHCANIHRDSYAFYRWLLRLIFVISVFFHLKIVKIL